jgi:hypothetical protein
MLVVAMPPVPVLVEVEEEPVDSAMPELWNAHERATTLAAEPSRIGWRRSAGSGPEVGMPTF